MDVLKEISVALVWLIRAGTVTRVSYCFFKMMQNADESGVYMKRIRNVIIFLIFSESIWPLKNIAISYFGGGGPAGGGGSSGGF